MINNIDLYKKKYEQPQIEENIKYLSIQTILKTQIIDYHFVINYIFNDDYCFEEETYLTWDDIYKYQPHLKKKK